MAKIYNALNAENGSKMSSKRLITMLLALTFIVVVIGHVFFGYSIDREIFSNLTDAVIWAIGIVGSEQFARQLPKMRFNRNNKVQIKDDEPEDMG